MHCTTYVATPLSGELEKAYSVLSSKKKALLSLSEPGIQCIQWEGRSWLCAALPPEPTLDELENSKSYFLSMIRSLLSCSPPSLHVLTTY